jgi:hypothetical protein
MKRLAALAARALLVALLLLAVSASVASADPGKGHTQGGGQPALVQPEDPGLGDGGYNGGDPTTQPEDPGLQ